MPDDTGSSFVRPINPGEVDPVREIAAASFAGYTGHYHADSRLEREACDDVYSSWAASSCVDRSVADEVLVAVIDDADLVAFATLRSNSADEGEGVLFGVAPRARVSASTGR